MFNQRRGGSAKGPFRRETCLKIALGLGMASVAMVFAGTSGIAQSRQLPSEIQGLKTLPDGKMLAILRFSPDSTQRTALTVLYRFNPDGSPDPNFNRPVFDDAIIEVTPQSDGKLLVHGLFTTVNGTAHGRIVRLNADGTPDGSFVHAPPRPPVIRIGLARS